MPLTYGQIIDRVLANVGDTRAGNTAARARILTDIEEALETEMAVGSYTEGFTEITLGGVNGTSDGVYAIPSGVRSVTDPLLIDGRVIISNFIHFDPADMWRRKELDQFDVGIPNEVLIHGLDFTFRPVPTFGVDEDTYLFRFYGTLYPDFSGITEEKTVDRIEFQSVLTALATALHAARTQNQQILAHWGPISEQRMSRFRLAASDSRSPAVGSPFYGQNHGRFGTRRSRRDY